MSEKYIHKDRLYRYRCNVGYIVDGDTLDLRVDLGFGIFKDMRVRLTGVDTAEIHGVKHESEEYKRGVRHMKFVAKWIDRYVGDELPFVVETEKDQTGKYGRYLGMLYDDEGNCLNGDIIEEFGEEVIYEC